MHSSLKILIKLIFYLSIPYSTIGMARYTRKQFDKVPPVDFTKATATKSDVKYYLHTNYSNREGLPLTDNAHSKKLLNVTLPTKLFFHGYTTDTTSPWYPLLRDAYFEKGPHNIIYVDWSKAGNLTYQESSANVNPVGEFVAEFLLTLGFPFDNVHLIGHSLGSHLTGFVGKHVIQKTGKKIGRITGLDPGSPAFENLPQDRRLCPDDALFVDIIHTDIDYYGFARPLGHVDFYPNGGKDQPGCKPNHEDENCSHARSTLFFVESVNHYTKATRSKLENNFQDVVVDDKNDDVIFGDGCPKTARGLYSMRTDAQPPYLISDDIKKL